MTKPYRIITVYSDGLAIKKQLEEIGCVFTVRDCFSGFWGKEFRIEKPKGKGAYDKMRAIDRI